LELRRCNVLKAHLPTRATQSSQVMVRDSRNDPQAALGATVGANMHGSLHAGSAPAWAQKLDSNPCRHGHSPLARQRQALGPSRGHSPIVVV